MVATTLLLGLAMGAIWLPGLRVGPRAIPLWPALLAMAVIAALVSDQMGIAGALVIVGLLASATAAVTSQDRRRARLLFLLSVALAFGLGIQGVPGFASGVWAGPFRLTPDATPMRVIFRFDQGVAGLVLVAFFCRRIHGLDELRSIVRPTLAATVIATFVVMTVATLLGFVRFEPKLPAFAGAQFASLLLWTSVLEEGFFRGVVQEGLTRAAFIASRSQLAWLPIVISAALFGLAHAAGGLAYVFLASIAGLGYSAVYSVTRRIEAPIVMHFLLNATHFIAFTYPSLSMGVQK
jgi:membrane protease YdiL (CAAX protease family)